MGVWHTMGSGSASTVGLGSASAVGLGSAGAVGADDWFFGRKRGFFGSQKANSFFPDLNHTCQDLEGDIVQKTYLNSTRSS